jgi:ATP-dependent DNA helicase RecG
MAMTKEELYELLQSDESYRIERTISTGNMDKFQEAICAFSNDLPGSGKKGYLLIGVLDDGTISGMKVDDALMKKIAGIRSDGNILPLPVMTVEKFVFPEGDILVVEVTPSFIPPIRYRGRVFVRIGPRKDIATEAEERILYERRTSFMATFDTTPCFSATIDDLDIETFRNKYLAKAISPDILNTDKRSIKEQMGALGMFDLEHNCPTYAAMILFGKHPRRFMPGAYVQFVRFKGETKSSDIDDERQFEDNYCDLLPKLETLLEMSIIKKYPVEVSMLREEMVTNYPYWAIRELLMNACMHRDLQSNTPLRIYEYSDRLEIMNAGGLYGNARPENFPTINDYRNPIIAGAMKTLGYVNMYNRGIGQVQDELQHNGNPSAEFNVNLITAFAVEVRKGTSQNAKGHKITGHKGTSQNIEGHKSENKPFGRNILSLQERIVDFCAVPRSMVEITAFLGVKDVRKARERYITPQLGVTLQRTIPDAPTSRNQKYVNILADLEKLKGEGLI